MEECAGTYQALRVVLRTVFRSSAMQRNDLVAENILARGKSLRNSNRPGVVLRNHFDSRPLAVLIPNTIDLRPLELLLLDRLNIASVGSDVGDDGTHVARRPGSPCEFYDAASSDLGHGVGGAFGRAGLVADDISGCVRVRGNEAVVEVLGVPAHVLGDFLLVLHGVVVVELVALFKDPVDGYAGDGTVSGDGSGKSRDGAEGGDSLVHVDDVWGGLSERLGSCYGWKRRLIVDLKECLPASHSEGTWKKCDWKRM
jgi:hypothetical protein